MTYKIQFDGSILRSDGFVIPADPNNTDYQVYLTWLAAGNVAVPVALPFIDFSNIDNQTKAIKAIGLVISKYTGKTVAQVKQDFLTAYNSLP